MEGQAFNDVPEGSPLRFDVLRHRSEIATAEAELRARGLVESDESGFADRVLDAVSRFVRRPRGLPSPDPIKSWDVLRALEAVRLTAGPDDAVLDVGCFASAVLPYLHRLGFRRLAGIDLDPRVHEMPFADEIEYVVGDLTNTAWPDAHFAAITAISVIEHGVPEEALLSEMARLLRPGGVFVFSTDYWPEKVDTRGVEIFDLPWRIFSADEIEHLVARASEDRLVPVADPDETIRNVGERLIRFSDRDYTFLFGALIRR